VVSDYGVAGAEGTQFAVFAGPDRNTFEVYQGRVSVQPAIPGATPLAIEAGYGALLERAAQPQVYPLPEHRIRAVLGNVRAADAAAVLDYEPIPLADPRRAPAPADPAAVREAQHWLQVLGYDPGPETGELNERTVVAIRRFQSDTGHPGTPVVDDALLEALAAEWKKRTEVIRDRAQPEGQTPGLPTPPEGKSYPPGYLTLDQIRRCAIDRISLDREKLAVDDELRQLNAAIESLNEQTAELQRQHAALENTDEAAVDAFNERVEAHRARMRRLEEGPQHAYDQHVAEWNGAQDEINERCIDKRVWRDDVDQVKRELGLKRFPFKVVSGS
jgi:peptidoglycan hydrolase-like protein with peptidoglycan-binding domain